MSWFDIIKNQIASTKGKQFQLDFSEPMIEDEETCKEKLLAIAKKFWELDFKQVLLKDIGFDDMPYASTTYKVNEGNNWEDAVSVTFARSSPEIDGLKNMPEEVACWFLENLQKTAYKNFTINGQVSTAQIRIQEIKKDRRFVYSLWYDSADSERKMAFHTSIRIESVAFRNDDTFMNKVGNYVNFQKLHEAIRNIVG
jgi:hypothetical protein